MPRSPVFIVGSPRSGTSALAKALSNSGYQGFNEGNFLPLITIVERHIDRHFALSAKPNPNVFVAQVDPQALKSRIEDIFKEITEALNPGPFWFDKSGNAEMIRAIPILRRLWPDSIYIFAKRRGIENVVSRVKKFPGHNFEYHCADWAKNMAAWREIREELPAGVYLEVDQQDLIRNTEDISMKIAEFLQLTEEQLKKLTNTFRSGRPQETSKGSAMKTYSFDSIGWTESEAATFKKYCASEMDAYGYSEGEEYARAAVDPS